MPVPHPNEMPVQIHPLIPSFRGALACGRSVLQDTKVFHKSVSPLQRRVSVVELCSAQSCPGCKRAHLQSAHFSAPVESEEMGASVSDTTFLDKILREMWKKSLMLFIDPVQPGWTGPSFNRLEISGLLLRICFPFIFCKHSSGDRILSLSCQLGCKVTSPLIVPPASRALRGASWDNAILGTPVRSIWLAAVLIVSCNYWG